MRCEPLWAQIVTSILETVQEPLVLVDSSLCVKRANRAFYQMFRLSEQDTETVAIHHLEGAWNSPALRALLEKARLDSRAFEEIELEGEFPQAGRKLLRINVRRFNGEGMIVIAIEDITARRHAEVELRRVQDELRQAQKMEAMGRLAGGVVHDFNNTLTGILGFSEMLIGSLEEGSDAFRQAAEIKKASERAATLTHQLLAFSRRQVLQPRLLNLNTVILELDHMLRRLIGDDIALDKTLNQKLWPMQADPGQMSQVILNLTLNARDAMPHGGVISIRTGNTCVDGIGERIRGLAPGNYVSLTVADSGTGMDHETQQHIFEPFYTTKPQGSGTGLGLTTVFGIVKQSGGSIQFASEIGRGTTFWVDFPRVETGPVIESLQGDAQMPTGTETILVVEDEEIVRELAVLLLKQQGYTVLEASQPSEGLALCQSHPFQIDLLLTDLLMPGGRDGRQLAQQASKIRPRIRVLLMSGYTTDALVLYGVEKGNPFLQKPFTLQQLARKVRDILDSRADLSCKV
jgi:signal transduction histidine kinase/CheY-like chemotaxis protein